MSAAALAAGDATQVAAGDQLGDNADRDFRHSLRADRQSERGVHLVERGLGDAASQQVLEDHADLPLAADHADVASRAGRQVEQGFLVMGVAAGHICGVPTRLFRVSFTGELGFEVNVPADFGAAVWEAVWEAGERFGMTPYGTETMHVLRAEKGYIIVGQDTDGTVTPDDAGLSWAIGRNKTDFVGKRSLQRPAMQSADRRQLVGLLTADPQRVLEEGSQVLARADAAPPVRPLGHVSSSYYSATLGRSIAMALVAGGRALMGQTLYVPLEGGGLAPAQVASPVFYDPKGARLNA